ncbi:hypothetical protein CBS9595_002413 [Malassezia furfur]|nr:hypothetical protein CBS9595_002413 [Malassezia furfur]
MATKGMWSTLSQARDPRIPGLLVRNEWVGSYEEFEEAVEYGELRQFLGVDTVAAPQPKPETTVQPAGSGRERIPPAPTLMATPSVASKSAYSEDADYMLSELLPQGTTISDADVDSLLKELEKPLKRTPRRTFTPSSRTAPSSLPSSSNTSASSTEHARYEPGTRNLVEEAARAIGVEPKPRGPAPRIKLNRRPLQEIMEERRARQAQTEHARRNDELFASLGLSDAQINDEDAEAFLRDGTIPEVQRKKTSPVPASTLRQPETNLRDAHGPDDTIATHRVPDPAVTTSSVPGQGTEEESFSALDAGKSEVEVGAAPDANKDTELTEDATEPGSAVEEQAQSDAAVVPEEMPEASSTGDTPVSARKSLQERLRKSVHLANKTATPNETDESAEAIGSARAPKSFDEASSYEGTTPLADDMTAAPTAVLESATLDRADQAPSTSETSAQDQQGAGVALDQLVAEEPDAPMQADASRDTSRSADMLDAKPDDTDVVPSTDSNVERVSEPTEASSSADSRDPNHVSEGAQEAAEAPHSADEVREPSVSVESDADTEADTRPKTSPAEETSGTGDEPARRVHVPEAEGAQSAEERNEPAAEVDQERSSQELLAESTGEEPFAQELGKASMVSAGPTSSMETGTALHQETTQLSDSAGDALPSQNEDNASMAAAEKGEDGHTLSTAQLAPKSDANTVLDNASNDANQDEASGHVPANNAEQVNEQVDDPVDERTDSPADQRTTQSELASEAPAVPTDESDRTAEELHKSLDKVNLGESPALEESLGTQMLAEVPGMEPSMADTQDLASSDVRGIKEATLGDMSQSSLGHSDGRDGKPMPMERHTLEQPLSGTDLADEGDLPHSNAEMLPAEGQTGTSLTSAMAELDVPVDHSRHPLEEPLSDAQLSKDDEGTLQEDRNISEAPQGSAAQPLVGGAAGSPSEKTGDASRPSQESVMEATQDELPPLPSKDALSPTVKSTTTMPSQDESWSEDKAGLNVTPSELARQSADVAMPSVPKVEAETVGAIETSDSAGVPEKTDTLQSTETESVPRSALVEPADSRDEKRQTPEPAQDPSIDATTGLAATPSLPAAEANANLPQTEPAHLALADSSAQDEAEVPVLQQATAPAASRAVETDTRASSDEPSTSSRPTTDSLGLSKADPAPSTHPSTASTHHTSHTHFHQGHTHWNNEQDLDEAVLAAPPGPQATHVDDSATLDHFAGSDGHVRDRLRSIQRSDSFQHGMRHIGHGATKEQERVALHQTLDRFSSLEPPLQADPAIPQPTPMAASTDVSRHVLEPTLDADSSARDASASASALPEETRHAAEQLPHHALPPSDRRRVSADASPEEERVAVHQVVDRFSALEPPLHVTASPRSPQPRAPDARHVSADASAEEERIAVHQVVDRFSGLEPPLHATSSPRSPRPDVPDARHVSADASTEEERIAVHQVVDRFSALEPPLHADLGAEESDATSRAPLARDPLESARIAQHQVIDRFSALEPPLPDSSADKPSDVPPSAAHPTSYASGNEPDSSEGEDDDDVPDLWVSNPSRASQALHRHSGVDSDWDAQASDMSGSVDEAVRVPVDLGKLSAAQRSDEPGNMQAPGSPPVLHSASSRALDESESDYSQDEESADNTPEHIVLSGAPAPLTAPPRPQDAVGVTSPDNTVPDRDTDTPKLEREVPASVAAARDLSGVSPSTPTKSALVAKQSLPSTPQHAGDVLPMGSGTDTPMAGSAHEADTSKAPAEASSAATQQESTATQPDDNVGAPLTQHTPSSESRDVPSGETDVLGTMPQRLPTSPQASLSTRSPRSSASPSLRSLRTPTRRAPEARSTVPKFLLDTSPPSTAVALPRSPPNPPQNAPSMQDDWLMQDSSVPANDAGRADSSGASNMPQDPPMAPSLESQGSSQDPADVVAPALPPRTSTAERALSNATTPAPSSSQRTEASSPTPAKRPVPPVPTTQAPPSSAADPSVDSAQTNSPRPSTEVATNRDFPASATQPASRPVPETTAASAAPTPTGAAESPSHTVSAASYEASTASSATEDDERHVPNDPPADKRRSASGTHTKRAPIPSVRSVSGTQRPGGHRKTLSAIMQEADAFLQEWKE